MSNLCNVKKTNKSLGLLVCVCDKLFESKTNYPKISNKIFFLIVALSSMSSSSFESQRSIRSSTSIQSAASYKSGMSFSMNTDFRFPHKIFTDWYTILRRFCCNFIFQLHQIAPGFPLDHSQIFKPVALWIRVQWTVLQG